MADMNVPSNLFECFEQRWVEQRVMALRDGRLDDLDSDHMIEMADRDLLQLEWRLHQGPSGLQKPGTGMAEPKITAEFQRGWDAALMAARYWHEAQAAKTMALSRRSRFPKNLEREAEVHLKAAEIITTLDPRDV